MAIFINHISLLKERKYNFFRFMGRFLKKNAKKSEQFRWRGNNRYFGEFRLYSNIRFLGYIKLYIACFYLTKYWLIHVEN